MSRPATAPDVLTPSEVARRFGVNAATVRRWARAGMLRSFLTVGGHHRYHAADVEALLAAHRHYSAGIFEWRPHQPDVRAAATTARASRSLTEQDRKAVQRW